MTQQNTFRILIADDDAGVREDYVRCFESLREQGSSSRNDVEAELFGSTGPKTDLSETDGLSFDLVIVEQGEAAVAAVREALSTGRSFCAALLDVRMPPGIDGVTAAERIRDLDKDVNIVLVTAFSDTDIKSIRSRVQPKEKLFYLLKPFHPIEIQQFAFALAHKWVAEKDLAVANQLLERNLDDVTAAFMSETDARQRAELLSQSKASILSHAG